MPCSGLARQPVRERNKKTRLADDGGFIRAKSV